MNYDFQGSDSQPWAHSDETNQPVWRVSNDTTKQSNEKESGCEHSSEQVNRPSKITEKRTERLSDSSGYSDAESSGKKQKVNNRGSSATSIVDLTSEIRQPLANITNEKVDNISSNSTITENEPRNETVQGSNCLRCYQLGTNLQYDKEDLVERFCPNCNQSIIVCLRHERCYSPHGLQCRQKGLKPIKRPYLRKKRTIFVADENFPGVVVEQK